MNTHTSPCPSLDPLPVEQPAEPGLEALSLGTAGGPSLQRLPGFLNIESPADAYAVVLPRFQGTARIDPASSYFYQGDFFVEKDARAAVSLACMVAQVLPPEQVVLRAAKDPVGPGASPLRGEILLGSISNDDAMKVVSSLARKFFSFEFDDAAWSIVTAQGARFSLPSPVAPGALPYDQQTDYGVLARLKDDSGKTHFLVAGLGSTATEGSARYLVSDWRQLDRQFGSSDFAVITRFRPPLDPSSMDVVAALKD